MKIRRGQIFGQLLVVSPAIITSGIKEVRTRSGWFCVCECGTPRLLSDWKLLNPQYKNQSCGCKRALPAKKPPGYKVTHKSMYDVWCSMKQRCIDKNHKSFSRYGGRGISVCEKWVHSFNDFLLDMGERPSQKHSIDRIDNDGDYCPENCRWATQKEQSANTRRNHYIVYNGIKKHLTDWAIYFNIPNSTLMRRIKKYGELGAMEYSAKTPSRRKIIIT